MTYPTQAKATRIYAETAINASADFYTKDIYIGTTNYVALYYKIGNAAETLTITIAYGFEDIDGSKKYTAYEAIQPTAINGFTGDTNWHVVPLSMPFCQYVKLYISGTSTDTSVVLLAQVY